uniref:Uncharacterized protein n=1 Tax=Picea sitchensis TaxID=3332 RepID=A9NLB9_PICSI|nr:unknown [Picea sitchensis]
MLQVILALGFSAAPLTLYLPPFRQLTCFLGRVDEVRGDAWDYVRTRYPRLWNGNAWRRIYYRCARFFGVRPPLPTRRR